MHRSGRVEGRRAVWPTREWRRVASSGVKVGGVGECNRVRLEWSEAVSRQKNIREAECLGEDTRLVCITGMTYAQHGDT
jgi:hypothetical protein